MIPNKYDLNALNSIGTHYDSGVCDTTGSDYNAPEWEDERRGWENPGPGVLPVAIFLAGVFACACAVIGFLTVADGVWQMVKAATGWGL